MSSATGRHTGMDLARKPILEELCAQMKKDSTICIIGEGARRKAELDYPDLMQFRDRIYTAPIAEGGIVAMGVGAAMSGLRPVCGLVFQDLSLRAMNEILNLAAKARLMTGNKLSTPMLICLDRTLYENAESGSNYDYLFDRPPPPTDRFGVELKIAKPRTVMEHISMLRDALAYDGPTVYWEDRLVQE